LFELIKLFAEQIIKTLDLSSLAKYRKSSKKAEIGANLFLLYSSLNRIYGRGIELLNELEHVCKRLDRYIVQGRTDETISSWHAARLLRDQYADVLKVRSSFTRLCALLDVISDDLSGKMDAFIGGKINAISFLGYLISGVTNQREDGTFSSALFGPNSDERLVHEIIRMRDQGMDRKRSMSDFRLTQDQSEAFQSISEMSRGQVEILRRFLSERNPRKQLEALKPILVDLHKKLSENFSIEDVLMKIGDASWRLDTDPLMQVSKPKYSLRETIRRRGARSSSDGGVDF